MEPKRIKAALFELAAKGILSFLSAAFALMAILIAKILHAAQYSNSIVHPSSLEFTSTSVSIPYSLLALFLVVFAVVLFALEKVVDAIKD